MPSRAALAMIRRRDVLIGAGRGAIGLALLTATATACGSQTPEVDPLTAQRELATADAGLARAAAAAAKPPLARTLLQIATERDAHAAALDTEMARAAGRPAPTTSAESATTTPVTGTPAPSVRDVTAALHRSAQSAAQLAPTLSGYRAGLLGSIAASVTASVTVALEAPEGKS